MPAKEPSLFKRSFGFLLLTLVLLYVTFWYVERWLFENILEKMIQTGQENGVTVTYQHMEASGFPDNLVFKLREINIRLGHVELYAPFLTVEPGLLFLLKNSFHFQIEDPPLITFSPYRGKGSYMRGSFFLENLRFKGLVFQTESLLVLREKDPLFKLAQGHIQAEVDRQHPDEPLLKANIRGSIETWFKELSLQTDKHIQLESRFHVSHLHTLSKAGEGLQAWQKKKGAVQFQNISLTLPQMDLMCHGDLYLDESLELIGDFTLKLQGFQRLFSLLNRHGIKKDQLKFLKLSLLFLPQHKDGSISIPLQLKKRRLHLMGLALPFSF